MEIEEIKSFIEQNKENPSVQEFIGGFNPLNSLTKETVSQFIDGNDTLKSYRDSFVNTSIDTWKSNNLKREVEKATEGIKAQMEQDYKEKVKKLIPQETEDQKKIRELEEKIEEGDKEKHLEKMLNLTSSNLAGKDLPITFAKWLSGNDEDIIGKNVEEFNTELNKIVDARVKAEVEKRLANSDTPLGGHDSDSDVNPWKGSTFNLTLQGKILRENPDLAKKMKLEAQKG